MKVLVTGASGYLGGRLTEYLCRSGDFEVRAASRRADARIGRETATAIAWQDPGSLDAACHGVDAVVHLAGLNTADSAAEPVRALQVNGINTGRIVDAAARNGVRRFVYLSTAHVYGRLEGTITEETCPAGSHPYATTHKAGEDAVRWAVSIGAIEGVAIRLSNAFGKPVTGAPGCWPLLINDLARQAVASERLVLGSSGRQRRDFIPVSTFCAAVEHLLRLPVIGETLLNLGSGWSPTVLEVAELVADRGHRVLGYRPAISRDAAGDARPSPPFEYSIDALLQTGFVASVDHEREIDELLLFCRDQFSTR